MAMYEANVERAYNLSRTGKILEMIDTSFGPAAKDVMQSLLLLGQARISDLATAYRGKIGSGAKGKASGDRNDGSDIEMTQANGTASHSDKKPDHVIKSTSQLNSVICRLVEADLIEVLHPRIFLTPNDIYKIVEENVIRTYFPAGVKGAKGKQEFTAKLSEELRKVRGESKVLKRKLEQTGSSAAKKRRLLTGSMANGNGTHDEDDNMDPALDVGHRRAVPFLHTVLTERS